MIEIFKTSLNSAGQAQMILDQIKETFPDYRANFDLDDCDKILRVQSTRSFDPETIINLLAYFGHTAQVLHDEIFKPEYLV